MAETSERESKSALALALFLGTAGTMHFVVPKFYDALIPKWLPGTARQWTLGSGVAEVACAVTVAVPRTRRLGGLLSALLFVAVLPGNVKMTVDYHRRGKPLPARLMTIARLPLQWPLIRWAMRVHRG